jgi:hypothetical protein
LLRKRAEDKSSCESPKSEKKDLGLFDFEAGVCAAAVWAGYFYAGVKSRATRETIDSLRIDSFYKRF